MNLNKPKIFHLRSKPEEKWFQNILDQLTPRISDQHPRIMFYKLNDEIVMEYYNPAGRQDAENGILWVSYGKIWSFFESNFGLEDGQIRGLIKGMVEEHFNYRDLTPEMLAVQLSKLVEEHFNYRDLTPSKVCPPLHLRWRNISTIGI